LRCWEYFCLWAGDSRVYQLRGGKLKRLTRDHRLVQELIDAGALNDAAASHHPQRNLLTRAVGTDRDLEFECCKGEVEAGDRFILVTDGVSGICSDEEIFAKTQSQDMNAAADALLELCLQRRAPDNLALILVAATNSI
jgi:serine/threonine-protein phosphatase Stp1